MRQGSGVSNTAVLRHSTWFWNSCLVVEDPGWPSATQALFDIWGDLAAWCMDRQLEAIALTYASKAKTAGWPWFVSLSIHLY